MKFGKIFYYVISGLFLLLLILFSPGVFEFIKSKIYETSSIDATVVYVSTFGNDDNDGIHPDKPVASITKAIDIAKLISWKSNVEVKIGAGLYSLGVDSGLYGFLISRPNLVISGGWNSNFSKVVGKSYFDGEGNVYHVIYIENTTNVTLRNLVISGGLADKSRIFYYSGGGIYLSNAAYVTIESNVVVSNNTAIIGGGICLHDSVSNIISCLVCYNDAKDGGGIYVFDSEYNIINGTFCNNKSTEFGGGVYLGYSSSNIIEGNVFSNKAEESGGGIFLSKSEYNIVKGKVYFNEARVDGGGICLEESPSNFVESEVYGNKSSYMGGGIYSYSLSGLFVNGRIYNNVAYRGGGLGALSTRYITVNGEVYRNKAEIGGGILLDSSDYFTNNGCITNNYSKEGSGVYLYRAKSYYLGVVTNNHKNDVAISK